MPPRLKSKANALTPTLETLSSVHLDGLAPSRSRSAPRKKAAALSAAESKVGAQIPINYGILETQIGFWVRRTNTRVLDSFSPILTELSLRPVEVTILVLLDNNVGMTQVALGTALDTDQSTMVSLLTRLEQRKLVSRKRLSTDRRFQVTALTPSGRRMLTTVENRLLEHNDRLLSSLTQAERKILIDLLRRLNAG